MREAAPGDGSARLPSRMAISRSRRSTGGRPSNSESLRDPAGNQAFLRVSLTPRLGTVTGASPSRHAAGLGVWDQPPRLVRTSNGEVPEIAGAARRGAAVMMMP